MNTTINNNTASIRSAQVQPAGEVSAPRGGAQQAASGRQSPTGEASRSASVVVSINPTARERASAEAGGQTGRPSNASAASSGTRVPVNVSAALRAYESAQQTNSNVASTQAQRGPAAQVSRSTSASNDPTGANNAERTRPTRASDDESAEQAQAAQERQQRDTAANLQSSAASTLRAGNQATRAVS